MNDFVRPVRRNPIPSPPARRREQEQGEPFVLGQGRPPESEAESREDDGPPGSRTRLGDLDVGHKPDDEEGAKLDVTG